MRWLLALAVLFGLCVAGQAEMVPDAQKVYVEVVYPAHWECDMWVPRMTGTVVCDTDVEAAVGQALYDCGTVQNIWIWRPATHAWEWHAAWHGGGLGYAQYYHGYGYCWWPGWDGQDVCGHRRGCYSRGHGHAGHR
jgi:hypothetical protein